MSLTDSDRIVKHIKHHHDGKVGYVVYRCTYGNDEKWAAFMARFSAFVDVSLDTEETWDENDAVQLRDLIIQLKNSFAWEVREDKAKYDGASMSEIRAYFNQWVASVGGVQAFTEYTNCIYADEEVVDAVLSDDPYDLPVGRTRNPKAFVKILDYRFREQPRQYSADVIPDDEKRAKFNAGDEGFEPLGVESCRREDVGWMKLAAENLMPRGYSLLMSVGWYIYYRRPPAIVND